MNADQWGELVDWLAKRYPDSQYTAEDVIVIFDDLKDFDVSDVTAAVEWHHEQGRGFPPNASMLLSRAIDERHRSARDDMYRGTPEERGKPIEWSDYAERRFGEQLNWSDAIARIHAQQRP